MEVYARVSKSLNQIQIQKRSGNFSTLMTVRDARIAHERGVITKMNKVMRRLVENDFDVTKTLAWYQEERERIRNSSTDEG